MTRYPHFIDGRAAKPSGGEWFDAFNPFTGRPLARLARGGEVDVDRAASAAQRALREGPWGRTSGAERGFVLQRLGDLITQEVFSLARLEVQDTGRPLEEVIGRVRCVAQWFHYLGRLACKSEGCVLPGGRGNIALNEPIGVVAVIAHWTSPLLMTAWKVAPALAAGCTVVIKPSEHASLSTLEFACLAKQAGIPRGVINVLTGRDAELDTVLTHHPSIALTDFAGSDSTGNCIPTSAADLFRQFGVELGGTSPNIIFEDANLDEAVRGVSAGVFAAADRIGVNGSRLLLQASIHDIVVSRLFSAAAAARIDDPLELSTQVGPVTVARQCQELQVLIDDAKQQGAEVLTVGQGAPAEGCGGWFINPTILLGVTKEMRIAQTEVAGPVLSILRFQDEEAAVCITNEIPSDLACGIWTGDSARVRRFSERLRNRALRAGSHCRRSFGDLPQEANHQGQSPSDGIRIISEYQQIRSVWFSGGAGRTS
ncbi:putative aldehyde dehydrogenase AldA [compost metagenome]